MIRALRSVALLFLGFFVARGANACVLPTDLEVDLGLTLSITASSVTAPSRATLTDGTSICYSYTVSVTTKIRQDSPVIEFIERNTGQGEYLGSLTAPAQSGKCYSATFSAEGAYYARSADAGPVCWSGGSDGGGHFHDEGGTPIVIKLLNGPWSFSSSNDAVLFDLYADGKPERWTWPARHSGIAFLALDRNLNGRVDDGSELFGPQTNGNGFELLRSYDESGEGVIDGADAVWSDLLLWTDANHNGFSEADELMSLPNAGIDALGLAYHWTAREDREGNSFRYQSLFYLDGRAKPYYDIFLRQVD